jgi:hypothetical protein
VAVGATKTKGGGIMKSVAIFICGVVLSVLFCVAPRSTVFAGEKTGVIVVGLQGDFTTWRKGTLAVNGADEAYVKKVQNPRFDSYSGFQDEGGAKTEMDAILFFEGTASPNGKTITQESRYVDPVRGPMTWRSVSRIVNDDTMAHEMFILAKGGKEEKMMEMTLTRKK